eukprot:244955-Amphidinium_carterae.1
MISDALIVRSFPLSGLRTFCSSRKQAAPSRQQEWQGQRQLNWRGMGCSSESPQVTHHHINVGWAWRHCVAYLQKVISCIHTIKSHAEKSSVSSSTALDASNPRSTLSLRRQHAVKALKARAAWEAREERMAKGSLWTWSPRSGSSNVLLLYPVY